MTLKSLFIFLLLLITAKSFYLNESQELSQLKTFLRNSIQEKRIYTYQAIIIDPIDNCNGLIDWYIKDVKDVQVSVIIVNEKNFINSYNISTTVNILMFIESLDKFEDVMDNLNYYEFINFNGNFQIIFCNGFESNYLNWAIKLLRRNYVLNFVLVYYHHVLNVVGYNHFTDTLLNFTKNYDAVDIFPNKLNNLYGYELKVSICNDYPRNVYENNSVKGSDLNLLKHITNHINATVKYIVHEDFTGIVDDMRNFKADFSFISYFASHKIHGVRFTQPQYMDNVIILVPDKGPIPLYLNILIVFDVRYLPALIIPSFSVLITLYLIRKFVLKENSFVKTYLDVISLQVNNPLNDFAKNILPIKLILISWIIHCLIINAIYESALITAYVTPKKHTNIDSLEELKESKLKIYIAGDYGTLVSNDNIVKDQLIYDSMRNVTKNLIINKVNYGYALPASYASEALHMAMENAKLKKTLRDFIRNPTFWLLKDILVPLHKVYLFPTRSIYLEKINKLISMDREHSLTKVINSERHKVRHRGRYYLNNQLTVLTLWHMQVSFYMLISGLISATIIFILEMIVYRRGRH